MTAKQSQDDQVLIALADRYSPPLRAYFSRRIADRGEVEDLTQEVFLSLLRRGQLNTIDNVEGYLFRIAANLLRLRARSSGRRPEVELEGYPDTGGRMVNELSPERMALGREAYQTLVQALQELPERARTIFVLNRFEELSGREIALRLGVSISLVEKEMAKAIAHLRGRLA